MVYLRKFKQLWLLLIAIFLHEIDLGINLAVIGLVLLLVRWFDESKFSSHGKVGHRAIDNNFIEPILEEILLHGDGILEVIDAHLWKMHNGSDIELINPMSWFAYA